ncbi:MAG TPA: hypothetical protein VGL28_00100, partial [Steroidobacteraceae bacterium]
MNAKSFAIARSIGVTVFAAIVLGVSVAAQAQSLQIAASLQNNQTGEEGNTNIIYGVTATPQTALPPALSLHPLPINPLGSFNFGGFNNNSLVYVPSTQHGATVDLVAVSSGSIYRFFGPFLANTSVAPTPEATIWNACGGEVAEVVRANALVTPSSPSESSGCNGPESPGAMAVDGNGTLYVLSQDGGGAYCEGTVVELWAFPKSPTTASGFAANPVLIDNNVAGPGGANSCSARDYSNHDISVAPGQGLFPNPSNVFDLMVAPAGVAAPVTPNDVLVMFGDQGTNVFFEGAPIAVLADYSAANLAKVLKGTAPLSPPLTVLHSTDINHWGDSPGGEGGWTPHLTDNALSVAAWPADSNILLLSENGNIYKVTWSSNTVPHAPTTYTVVDPLVFWSGLPSVNSDVENGTQQVDSLRTGAQSGISYAFVTANTPASYAEYYGASDTFGPPAEILSLDGTNTPQTVSTSDGPFAALAVSSPPSGTGTGAQCVTGCNLSGGNQQLITGTPAAIAAIDALGAKGKITET